MPSASLFIIALFVHLFFFKFSETFDGIELEELNSNRRSTTPPVGCSSRNSVNREGDKVGISFEYVFFAKRPKKNCYIGVTGPKK